MPFTPQLTIPDINDVYFIRKGYGNLGGLSPCVAGYPERAPGNTLANCVGYCWGIAAKREEDPNCNIGFGAHTTWPVDAWHWVDHLHGRTLSMTVPQLGAIACWIRNDGKSGHVASVEQIDAAGNCRCSESGYGLSTYFRTTLYMNDGTGGLAKSGFTFQGYIYLHWPGDPPLPPEYDEDVLYPLVIGDRVLIAGRGKSDPNGGATAYGIGWTRYVQGVIVEGQYPFKVGRLNGGTTGYYKENALKLIETDRLHVGDWVRIDSAGNSKPDGKGAKSFGIGWKRQILSVRKGKKYPYRLGKDGKTTGYYQACDFTKLES